MRPLTLCLYYSGQSECRKSRSISGRPLGVRQEFLAVAEFARIQVGGDCPNSGEFGYRPNCQEFLPHPSHVTRPHVCGLVFTGAEETRPSHPKPATRAEN